MLKITKRQEYVDDKLQDEYYQVYGFDVFLNEIKGGRGLVALSKKELLELKEAINNLDIK